MKRFGTIVRRFAKRVFAYLNRCHLPFWASQLCVAIGIFLVVGALKNAWMIIPASLPVSDYMSAEIGGQEAPVTPFFKGLYGLFVVLLITLFFRKGRARIKRVVVCCTLGFVALGILYPYMVWQLNPKFASAAQWLYAQHYHLTWLGGDIFTRQEETFNDDNLLVYVVDPPRGAGVTQIPQSLPALFQLGRIGELQGWLGYTSSFCQFVSKGWVFAMGSFAMFILGGLRSRGRLDLALARSCLKYGVASFCVFVSLGMIPIAHTAYQIGEAHKSVQKGLYEGALIRMEKAAWTMPIISEDSYFFAQKGLIAYRAGLATPESHYHQASVFERDGFYYQAEQLYSELLDEFGYRADVRRECLRALNRAGVYDLNTQQLESAERKLLRTLAWDPTDLKANYTLQMIWQRMRNDEGLAKLSGDMVTIYTYFQAMNKKPVLNFSRRNLEFSKYHVPGTKVGGDDE